MPCFPCRHRKKGKNDVNNSNSELKPHDESQNQVNNSKINEDVTKCNTHEDKKESETKEAIPHCSCEVHWDEISIASEVACRCRKKHLPGPKCGRIEEQRTESSHVAQWLANQPAIPEEDAKEVQRVQFGEENVVHHMSTQQETSTEYTQQYLDTINNNNNNGGPRGFTNQNNQDCSSYNNNGGRGGFINQNNQDCSFNNMDNFLPPRNLHQAPAPQRDMTTDSTSTDGNDGLPMIFRQQNVAKPSKWDKKQDVHKASHQATHPQPQHHKHRPSALPSTLERRPLGGQGDQTTPNKSANATVQPTPATSSGTKKKRPCYQCLAASSGAEKRLPDSLERTANLVGPVLLFGGLCSTCGGQLLSRLRETVQTYQEELKDPKSESVDDPDRLAQLLRHVLRHKVQVLRAICEECRRSECFLGGCDKCDVSE